MIATLVSAAAAMMLVTVNGAPEPTPPREFSTMQRCNAAKPKVKQAYPSNVRYHVRVECIPK